MRLLLRREAAGAFAFGGSPRSSASPSAGTARQGRAGARMSLDLIINIVGLIAIPIATWALATAKANKSESEAAAAKRQEVAEAGAAERKRENDLAHDELRKYCERLNSEFTNFRLDTAQRYATMVALREMETRWMNTFQRIEDKLDRALTQREHA
jgi:hypothetical protein